MSKSAESSASTTPKANREEPASEPAANRSPLVTIEPPRGWLRINWRELWAYRDLAWTLAMRNIQVRYKQAVLGGLWAVLQPLVAAGIFTLVFSRLFEKQVEGVPYLLFAFSGMVPWLLFSTTISGAASSLVDNTHLITKVYFPRLLVPLSVTGYTLLDFLLGLAVLGVMLVVYAMLAVYEIVLTPAALALPLVALGILACAVGCGVFLAAMTVKYRDFRFIVPFMLQLWLFLSPVIYPISVLPENVQGWLRFNPMTGFLEAFRHCLFGTALDTNGLAISCGVTTVLLLGGLAYFRQVEDYFADIA